ncbi:hypothetical protein ABEB36_000044 [Hypothenemus hampei]|uniref:Uncharacterized protein n=1 Tax=Hypothenemus hampei TaxID=57062 RepID=A0ABD1FDQ4_HYPHA
MAVLEIYSLQTSLGDISKENKQLREKLSAVEKVNNWFDIFNVNVPVSDSRSRNRAYGLPIQEQDEILDKMSKKIQDLKVKCRQQILSFQNSTVVFLLFMNK